MLKCELHVKSNVACFIRIAVVAAAATVGYISEHSVLCHIDTILIQSHTATGDDEYHMLVWKVQKPVQILYIALKQWSLWEPNRMIGHTAAQPMEE